MRSPRIIERKVAEIVPVSTAHGIGLKSVLLSQKETVSVVTQIAITQLKEGECVEEHVHPTMDEHYLFMEGYGKMRIDEEEFECRKGVFLLVPAKSMHGMRAITAMKFITIGIAL